LGVVLALYIHAERSKRKGFSVVLIALKCLFCFLFFAFSLLLQFRLPLFQLFLAGLQGTLRLLWEMFTVIVCSLKRVGCTLRKKKRERVVIGYLFGR